jgi:hypothetical protein
MLLHFHPMIDGFEHFVENVLPFVNQTSLRTAAPMAPAAE